MGALWTDEDGNAIPHLYLGYRLNYYPLLVPYLEQQNIHDLFDFSTSSSAPWQPLWYDRNREAAAAIFPTLFCPSDGYGGTHHIHPTIPDQPWSRTNYIGMFTGFQIGDLLQYDPAKRAFFDGNRSTQFKDILDGTSNTIAMTEGLREINGPDGRGMAWSDQPCGAQVFSELAPNSPLPDRCYPVSSWWCMNPDPANNRPCVYGDGRNTDTCAARSMHPGGVVAVFADGSTHFISESIDLASWRAAATIMAEELVAL